MDYQTLYQEKLTTAGQAVKTVQSGDWVDYGWLWTKPWQPARRNCAM